MIDYVVNLESIIPNDSQCLVGESNGKLIKIILKDTYCIDFPDLEKRYEMIFIRIPERIVTVTDSYMRGMFGDRIKVLGKEFLNKYKFVSSEHVCDKIEGIVTRQWLKL